MGSNNVLGACAEGLGSFHPGLAFQPFGFLPKPRFSNRAFLAGAIGWECGKAPRENETTRHGLWGSFPHSCCAPASCISFGQIPCCEGCEIQTASIRWSPTKKHRPTLVRRAFPASFPDVERTHKRSHRNQLVT